MYQVLGRSSGSIVTLREQSTYHLREVMNRVAISAQLQAVVTA